MSENENVGELHGSFVPDYSTFLPWMRRTAGWWIVP